MDEIYRNLSIIELYPIHPVDEQRCKEINVTEQWLDHSSGTNGKPITITRSVRVDQLKHWLDEGAADCQPKDKSLILRLVWVEVEARNGQYSTANLSHNVKKEILDSFGLGVAYGYCKTCLAGVTAYPSEVNNGMKRQAYSFSYMPKLAAVWSSTQPVAQSPQIRPGIVQGLIFIQKKNKPEKKDRKPRPGTKNHDQAALADRSFKDLFLMVLEGRWQAILRQSSMFPAFLISLVLGGQIDATGVKIGFEIRSIERYTGMHQYNRNDFNDKVDESVDTDENAHTAASLKQHNKQKELVTATSESAKTASAVTSRLASLARKRKTLEKLLDFIISRQNEEGRLPNKAPTDPAHPTDAVSATMIFTHHISVLQQRLDTQAADAEHLLERVKVQKEALFNLVNQEDSLLNYKLSRATAKIAYSSYRDASSMKTLAFVTMIFLPGSFISALFSTNCFDWDEVSDGNHGFGVPVKQQFWLYWFITIPVTGVILGVYFAWIRRQRPEEDPTQHSEPEPETDSKQEMDGENIHRMRERTTTLLQEKMALFGRSPTKSQADPIV